MNRRFWLLTAFALMPLLQAQQKASKPTTPASNPASDPQLYRNASFGFHYRIPGGWVDRTKDLQEGDGQTNNGGKGEVLLAVFERPPQAAGDTVNSAVVIAVESGAAYPGLKTADDYIGPLTELTTARGFKTAGEPQAVEIDGRQPIRADFTKVLNPKLTMRQSTLVLLQKGQIVSFTFIAGSQDEVDQLLEGLSFASKGTAAVSK